MIVCSGGDAIDRYKYLDCKIISLPILNHENRNLSNFIKSILLIHKIIISNEIDIIHSHNHYAANIGRLSTLFTKAKTIQTIHGLIPDIGILPHYVGRYYIAVNEHIENELMQLRKKNVSLIRCGIKLPNKFIKKDFNEFNFLVSTRFIKEKGNEELIEYISYIPQKILYRSKFVFAGEGVELVNCYKKASKARLNILFVGCVKKIEEYFIKSNIFLTNSKNEGFPTSMIYAGAYSNIVLSYNFKGLADVLTDKEDCYIFNNKEEFLNKVNTITSNIDINHNLSMNYHKKVMKMYDIKKSVDNHINLYKVLLNKN